MSLFLLKSYITRVGEGPFFTEIEGESGEKLQKIGKEFGATTGRKRRCGWFDAVLARKSIQLNGSKKVILTKLDVLSALKEIQVCTAYEVNGEKYQEWSWKMDKNYDNIEPVYTILQGWEEDISDIRYFKDLPKRAKEYVLFLEKILGVEIILISVGPGRDQILEKGELEWK